MQIRVIAPLLSLCALLAACQSAPKPPATPPPAPETAAAPVAWVRTEIFFPLAPADAEGLGLAAAEGTWRTFVDEEVAARFPDGFTALDALGQGRSDETSPVERVRGKLLIIVHPATAARRAGIDALCAAYRQRTGAQTPTVVETPVNTPRG